jgi:polar amino acid transport system substrate-binding protein
VGTDAAYAPFEFQNEKGEIVGLTVDVVTAVAKKAGIEVSPRVLLKWENGQTEPGYLDIVAIVVTAEPIGGIDWFLPPLTDAQKRAYERAKSKSVEDL